MGDQPGHRGAAGLIGGEDLAGEHPVRDKGREDPVLPGGLDLLDGVPFREDLGEGKAPLAEDAVIGGS